MKERGFSWSGCSPFSPGVCKMTTQSTAANECYGVVLSLSNSSPLTSQENPNAKSATVSSKNTEYIFRVQLFGRKRTMGTQAMHTRIVIPHTRYVVFLYCFSCVIALAPFFGSVLVNSTREANARVRKNVPAAT